MLIVVLAVLMWILSGASLTAAAGYGDSAHGDNATGVDRSMAECQYWPGGACVTGSCAHCHDTFDPGICGDEVNHPKMLFEPDDNPSSQTDNFCFQCHGGNGTYQIHTVGMGANTATWRPTTNTTANYNIYARWVAGPTMATDAPYTIYYTDTTQNCTGELSETVRVNQQQNGGQWVLLGTYPFAAGTSGRVVLSDDANGYVIADAIKWEFDSWTPCFDTPGSPPSFHFVLDNLTAKFVGDWISFVDHSAYPTGGNASVQIGGIVNQDYGATFGGGIPRFDSVYDAFNPDGTYASSHNLADVQNYAKGRAWGGWMTDNTNACTVCHDHHFSQKNFPVTINLDGGVNTALRRGNDVVDYPGDLWGDEPNAVSGRNEMMSDWVSNASYIYQAPYRGDSGHEPGPAGSTIQDGSNLPNFVDACAQTCHRQDVSGREAVNWKLSSSSTWPGTPSLHGRAAADGGGFGVLKAPYDEAQRGSYVLSCTDCHEPHGSTNPSLLRTTVNGVSALSTAGPGSLYPDGAKWYYFCQACHDLSSHFVIYPDAHCGDNVGCHMNAADGGGGNHGFEF